jgi:integrase
MDCAEVKVAKKKNLKKDELPRYVVIKYGQWHVRRMFPDPDGLRDSKGRLKHISVSRRCVPETKERADELSKWIETGYNALQSDDLPSTVGEYLEQYLSAKKKNVERRTYEHDNDLFNRYIKKHRLASKILADIQPMDLQNLLTDIQDKGASAIMAKKVYVFLSSALNQAVRWKKLAENPSAGVMVPKTKRSEKVPLSKTDLSKFWEVCKTRDDFLIFDLALETGLRPQEYLALEWPVVDVDANKIKVVKALASGFVGGGFEIKIPKTDASYRTVVISPRLADRLEAHRRRNLAHIQSLRDLVSSTALLKHMQRKGANYKKRMAIRQHAAEHLANFEKYDLVFPSSTGLPQSRINLNNREFKDACEAAGIDKKKYSLTTLRHTNLSILAERWPPKRLQKHAGHARITTTMEYYVHVDEDAQYSAGSDFADSVGKQSIRRAA